MELFIEGGLKDEGGSVDPVSGNDVPVGSTKKEVRDDIPAMLSEGEFVFPADVTRFIGLEKLMQQRQDAKMGLKTMEAMGQMGNSEEATMPDDMPFGPADLVILGRPEEDEPKEMYGGGMVYANQGTFATGIGGYQPSVFQGQPQTSAPYVPPSSVAPPPPAPSPAGGYMPKFMGAFDDGSLAPKTTTSTTGTTGTTGTTTTSNTGTTGTTNDFVPTVDDVYTQKEYFNPETGETRVINFYNNNPVNEIPEGFVLKEDYVEDETTTTDLESTSVESTQVRDDNSQTKARLERMVRDQGGQTQLNKLKENIGTEEGKQAVKDAYIANEKFKSLLSFGTGIFPIAGVARFGAGYQGKQLEKLMDEKGITKPEIEEGFFERVKGAFSDMFKGAGEKPEIYKPMYDPQDSPLSTVSDATNMLSTASQKSYDNAVKSGNARVAEHHEMMNNRLNKMSDYAAGKAVSGLSKFDKEQADKMFDSKGTKLADSVNKTEEARLASKERRKKKEQKEKIDKKNKEARERDPSKGTTGNFAGTETI